MNQVLGLLYVAVVVLFIAASWRILSKGGKPGWAALVPFYNLIALLQVSGRSGWWTLGLFVPFLNFVRPKSIANDIWRGSDPTFAPEATVEVSTPVPWYLNVWWAAFLISGIAGRIAFSSARNAKTLSGLNSATTTLIWSDALDLVAAIAAIAVVVEIFRRQQLRASSVAAAEATA